MNTTTNDIIRCPYCGQIATKAQARACGRQESTIEPDREPDERWLGNDLREIW